MKTNALLVTIPHSGEKIPEQCTWLRGLDEQTLMCDVDRFVDRLYEPCLQKMQIPYVKSEWHRYAVDLNRRPSDVDPSAVLGATGSIGKFAGGFHWVKTTRGQTLMPQPMSQALHQELVRLIYDPFHLSVEKNYENLKSIGAKQIYHLDAHSMPSLGTELHRDPGELRADIVISDCLGKSSRPEFVDLVIASFSRAGFKVAYNWPYIGGRLTEHYGNPGLGHHSVQVELNRSLYMNEESKQLKAQDSDLVRTKIEKALDYLVTNLELF